MSVPTFGDERESAGSFGVPRGDQELTGGAGEELSRAAGGVFDDADEAAVLGVTGGDTDPDVGFADRPAAGLEQQFPAGVGGENFGVVVDDGRPNSEGVL